MGDVVEKMGVVVEEHSWDLPHSGSYEAAMEALSSLITRQKRGDKSVALRGKYSKLERMMMYIKILGLEEKMVGLRIIHVAGTKGKVDVAIIEVGLGGTRDSTNVILTAVSYILAGDTLGKIASHKAGIFKSNAPAFTAPQLPEAMDVIKERAQQLEIPLGVVSPLRCEVLNGLQLSLAGDHQFINAGLAVALCKSWLQHTGNWGKLFAEEDHKAHLPDAFMRGLSSARLSGRAQIVYDSIPKSSNMPSGDLIFHLDGAHSPESMEACGRWFSAAMKQHKNSTLWSPLNSFCTNQLTEAHCRNGFGHAENGNHNNNVKRTPPSVESEFVEFLALFVPSMSTYNKVVSGSTVTSLNGSTSNLSWQFDLQSIWEKIINGNGVKRNLSHRGVFAVQLRAMGSGKKDKTSINQKSQKDVCKENVGGNKSAGILSIEKVESMTVQELRAALRNVGSSSKGRKEELVSALKTVLDVGTHGKSALANEKKISNDCRADENSSKTLEEEIACVQESVPSSAAIAEASKCKQSKRKEKHTDDQKVEIGTDIKKVKQSASVQTSDLSGKKRYVKRKVTVETASINVEVSQGLDESSYEREPWTRFAHKKPQKGWIVYNPSTMRPSPLLGGTNFVKLVSWNTPPPGQGPWGDIYLQYITVIEKDVETVKDLLEGYENSFWTCSLAKAGYSGTAIVSRIKPLSVRYGLGISDHDTEGRLVTAEFDSFYLLCAYVPNSGDGLRRLGNKRSAGFTIEERQSFEDNFLSKGFVDTFRRQHPNVVGYTYWGYRHGGRKKNHGWRLDYFLVSESIADRVHDSYILPDINGSDHCPIGLVLKL
ncbi:hypothetical protein Cgig2_001467 [Carnegiea gigantea]|uniref:SAP domain-containing protein n=1 Tax=Carnegiea gigantea TaxID=171969 RepID=A0A9Q1KVY5_9CARY|nr:hypothetical protein Cgig2_001467 [Carnegiea gigantea]